jgi:hypothetical protein
MVRYVLRSKMSGATDDVLEESYRPTVGEMAVIKSGLDILSLEYAQAKQTDPNLLIDPSLVRQIEQSGFIDGLYER